MKAPTESDPSSSSSTSSFATVDTPWGYPSALTFLLETKNYNPGLLPRCVPELQILELQGIIKEKDEWRTKIHNPTIATTIR